MSAERIHDNLPVSDKRSLLRRMAHDAATRAGLNAADVEEALLARERLGSTGLGQRIAIPHARLAGLKSVYCALYKLAKPIEFDAIDDLPVDIAALLLIPLADERHGIQALSCIARTLKSPELLADIRDRARAARLSDLVLSPSDRRGRS